MLELQRSLGLAICSDGEFRRLAPLYPNTVVIDRDGIEFHSRDGLNQIIRAAKLPPFPEIPYRRS